MKAYTTLNINMKQTKVNKHIQLSFCPANPRKTRRWYEENKKEKQKEDGKEGGDEE